MKSIFSALIGIALGAGVSWLFCKKYYENIANEDIANQKKWFQNKCSSCPGRSEIKSGVDNNVDDTSFNEDDARSYYMANEIIKRYREDDNDKYKHVADEYNKRRKEFYEKRANGELVGVEVMNGAPSKTPYPIPPEEFGEYSDYENIELRYFSDGVITDENDIPVSNPDDILGEMWRDNFGMYRSDILHIRNDVRKVDYEILRILDPFSEVIRREPYKEQ